MTFPAQAIIKLDDNESISNIDKIIDDSSQKVIGGIRIAGLLKQTQCLLTYALEMFHDLSDSADQISQKVTNIEKRASKVSDSLSKYNNSDDFWEEYTDNQTFAYENYKQFYLSKSRIVENMISHTNKPPNFNDFNLFEQKIRKSNEVNKIKIDFNNFFSDPQYFQNQYIEELVKQLNKEKEERKEAMMKQKLKEKRKRQDLLKKLNDKDIMENNELINMAIAQPPPHPSKLKMPPPKGQARHETPTQILRNDLSNENESINTHNFDHVNHNNKDDKANFINSNQSYRKSSISEDKTNNNQLKNSPTIEYDSIIKSNKPSQTSFTTTNKDDKANFINSNQSYHKSSISEDKTNNNQLQNSPTIEDDSIIKSFTTNNDSDSKNSLNQSSFQFQENSIPPPPPPPPPPPEFFNQKTLNVSVASGSFNNPCDVTLKQVNSNVKDTNQPEEKQANFLDLIKNGRYVLKPVDRTKPLGPPPKPKEQTDPNKLSIQELLMEIAIIRDLNKSSDSSSDSEEEDSESSKIW